MSRSTSNGAASRSRERRKPRVRKLTPLHLRANARDEIQRLAAIVSLGMCRALATGSLKPEYACHQLFGPALLDFISRVRAVPELKKALHLGMELADVAELAPDAYAESLAEVEALLLKALKRVAPAPLSHDKWLVRGARRD